MRRLLLAAAALPLTVAAAVLAGAAPGCGSSELEDICAWMKDPSNCYRKFHLDTGDRCGAIGVGKGPIGRFAGRDKLDTCFLDQGGQVVFDPALDPTKFPVSTVKFTRLDAQAATCGSVSFSGQFNYSVTIDGCAPAAATPQTDASALENDAGPPPCIDADGGGVSGMGSGPTVTGGTVSIATPASRDTYDTTCPGGETHHFNRIDSAKCQGYAQLVPRAEIEMDPGKKPPPGAQQLDPFQPPYAGYVRFRVYYPPTQASVGSDGNIAANTQLEPVEYFNCIIPAPAPICFNGTKDSLETDVDCGGTVCSARCGAGQGCITDKDCGSGLKCQLDNTKVLKCQALPDGGAADGG